jgi:hypothetical protein
MKYDQNYTCIKYGLSVVLHAVDILHKVSTADVSINNCILQHQKVKGAATLQSAMF